MLLSDNINACFIQIEFRIWMVSAKVAKVHTFGFCFRKLKPVFIRPRLEFIETLL